MIIHEELQQGTPEWFKVRKGKMTASHAQAIASNGKGLETYIYEILSELYSSGEVDFYTNKDMDRGNELEPLARAAYEMQTGNTVKQVGFIEYSDHAGASPDGLVDDDPEGEGGIEIKCKNDKKYFMNLILREKEIESAYKWQMQMCMLVSGRKWWDFVAYNPNFKESLIIVRFHADPEMQESLIIGLSAGKKKIEEITSTLKV